jgi:beta-phosphoglucomutase-like phosphatase (HAD superfamily)
MQILVIEDALNGVQAAKAAGPFFPFNMLVTV